MEISDSTSAGSAAKSKFADGQAVAEIEISLSDDDLRTVVVALHELAAINAERAADESDPFREFHTLLMTQRSSLADRLRLSLREYRGRNHG